MLAAAEASLPPYLPQAFLRLSASATALCMYARTYGAVLSTVFRRHSSSSPPQRGVLAKADWQLMTSFILHEASRVSACSYHDIATHFSTIMTGLTGLRNCRSHATGNLENARPAPIPFSTFSSRSPAHSTASLHHEGSTVCARSSPAERALAVPARRFVGNVEAVQLECGRCRVRDALPVWLG